MSKKKKQKLDEGMILMSPMLPVGGVHGLGGFKNKEDNFEFKGFPGQFDEDGKKIMDEQGNKVNEATDKRVVELKKLEKEFKKLFSRLYKVNVDDTDDTDNAEDAIYSAINNSIAEIEGDF